MCQQQTEIQCMQTFFGIGKKKKENLTEKETWLCTLAFVVNKDVSHTFLSWACSHIYEMLEIAKEVDQIYQEKNRKSWSGISTALAVLERASVVITRASTLSLS